jgi:hypothetical protein
MEKGSGYSSARQGYLEAIRKGKKFRDRTLSKGDQEWPGDLATARQWQELTMVVDDVHDDDRPPKAVGYKRMLRPFTPMQTESETSTAKRRRDVIGGAFHLGSSGKEPVIASEAETEFEEVPDDNSIPEAEDEVTPNGALDRVSSLSVEWIPNHVNSWQSLGRRSLLLLSLLQNQCRRHTKFARARRNCQIDAHGYFPNEHPRSPFLSGY